MFSYSCVGSIFIFFLPYDIVDTKLTRVKIKTIMVCQIQCTTILIGVKGIPSLLALLFPATYTPVSGEIFEHNWLRS